MEGTEKSKASEKESPPLQIDPKWYVLHGPSLASLATEYLQF